MKSANSVLPPAQSRAAVPLPTRDLTDLPQYEPPSSESPRGPHTEHEYSLYKSGKPWLTLKVLSHASLPNSLPVFIEGRTISGSVEIDVSNLTNVQEITLSVSLSRVSALITRTAKSLR
jgi:hypothetical protein